MARQSVIEREKKRIKLVEKYREKRDSLRKIISSPKSSEEDRWEAQMLLQKLPRNSSASRVTRRCSLTGRPKGVYRKFGLGRSMLRIHAMNGEVPGLRKASW